MYRVRVLRGSVSAFEVQQLEGKDNELGGRIQEYINSKIVDKVRVLKHVRDCAWLTARDRA